MLTCVLQGDLGPEVQFGSPGTTPKSLNRLSGSPLTATLTVLGRAFTKRLLFQLTVA